MVSAAVRLPGFAPPFSYNPSISPGFGGSGGSTLLPLTLEFLQDDRSWSSTPPTLETPCLLTVRMHNTAGWDHNWDTEYTLTGFGTQLVADPDPTGVRTGERGANRDMMTDQRGPWATFYLASGTAGTLTVTARDLTPGTNSATHQSAQELTASAISFGATVTVGTGQEFSTIASALGTHSTGSVLLRLLNETHTVNTTISNRDQIVIEPISGQPILAGSATGNEIILGFTGNGSRCIARGIEVRGLDPDNYYDNGGLTGVGLLSGPGSRNGFIDCSIDSPGGYPGPTVRSITTCMRFSQGTVGNEAMGGLFLRVRGTTSAAAVFPAAHGHVGDDNANSFYNSWMGVEFGSSQFEDSYRSAVEPYSAGGLRNVVRWTWCSFDQSSVAGPNVVISFATRAKTNKQAFRPNRTELSFCQENWFAGRAGFASTSGLGGGNEEQRSFDLVFEGNFYGGRTETPVTNLNMQDSAFIGGGGSRISIKANIFEANSDQAHTTTPTNAIDSALGPNNGADPYWDFTDWALRGNTILSKLRSDNAAGNLMSMDGQPQWRDTTDFVLRGNLWVLPTATGITTGPDAVDAGTGVLLIGAVDNPASGRTLNTHFSLCQENIYPTDAAAGTFADDSVSAGFPLFSDYTSHMGVGAGSVDEAQEAHGANNLVTNNGGSGVAYLPYDSDFAGGDEGTAWRTQATPDPRCRRDYVGNLRNQTAASIAVGAIDPTLLA